MDEYIQRVSIESILAHWRRDLSIAENMVHVETIPARLGQYENMPDDLHPDLQRLLKKEGLAALYSHQRLAYDLVRTGRHVAVVTGTASGKTLCYNLPVIDTCLKANVTRALYLFPTKALTQDQYGKLSAWLGQLAEDQQVPTAVYDGDTPSGHRGAIRGKAQILLTNPDMLHMGILPHHTLWADFFRNLRFVVVDEMHMYRGVFGSHLANVLRRLQRIAAFYGAYPQFIMTSATIANPKDLAEQLIEQAVTVTDEDGSPAGARFFVLYNPPVINPTLGIRASPLVEGQKLIGDLMASNAQTITFAQTRRAVELLLRYLREFFPDHKGEIEGYRSGYLPSERRAIERNLREGITRAVVATNALELGIDIGSLSAALLIGYPGTIASTRQQAGRAGRKTDTSLAVLVASGGPLDQYLIQHPEYLFGRSPEQALIDPNNPLILLQHLRCAAFELPFKSGEAFGNLPYQDVEGLLASLSETGELHPAGGRYFWTSDQFPASRVSLRTSDPDSIKLQAETETGVQIIGLVDQPSAYWMVHPQAVYLHAGQSYWVENLDLEHRIATLTPKELDYYTEPLQKTTIEKIAETSHAMIPGATHFFGDIKVTSQVTGFRKVRWYTRENIGESPLEMPPSELFTTGYWAVLSDETIDKLRRMGLWQNDPNHYGPGWDRLRLQIRLRDRYTCQMCGKTENGKTFHVHHKIPFRQFQNPEEANRPDNLITLCSNCHQLAETNLRMRSGLSGLSYILHNLSPLFLMCDAGDIETHYDAQSSLADGKPVVVLYDKIPAGIGLAQKTYQIDEVIFHEAAGLIRNCACPDGCPSCVGPAGENGAGGKLETLAILGALLGQPIQPEAA